MPLPQAAIDLYDRFTHGQIERRAMLDGLNRLLGTAGAASALTLLTNDYAAAQLVSPTDPRLRISRTGFDGPDGKRVEGMLARLADDTPRPALIVIHENRGLNPHIEDVTRRFALEGFHAFGIDMLSPDGGTPSDEDRARTMIGALDPALTAQRLAAAVPFLASAPGSNGKVGAVGFCWGGGMVNVLAVRQPSLGAGVAYYGRQAPANLVPGIRAALMLHYASNDAGINAGIDAYRAALTEHGKSFELHMYEGAQHAFNNDTNAARYDKGAAELAWGRSVAFLKRHLT